MEKRMKIRHICFFSDRYPIGYDPAFSFLGELVKSIADLGIICTVISPQNSGRQKNDKTKRPYFRVEKTENGSEISIYHPVFPSISKLSKFGYNDWMRSVVALKCYKEVKEKSSVPVDVIYAHFWDAGAYAIKVANKYNLPLFVATGESIIPNKKRTSVAINKYYDNLHGCICVSQKNQEESISMGLVEIKKTIVIPNSIDPNAFYRMNKKQCREKLKIDDSAFVTIFVGSFDERKGVNRVAEAIDELDNVKSIYIGKGAMKPNDRNCIFCGPLPHHELVTYLNAADVFVLPTRAEGCCNAIIEAMACGLPIISSNKSFNNDILNSKYAIFTDSEDIKAIRDAITFLRDHLEERKQMAYEAYEASTKFHLNERANKIMTYIRENSK